MQMYLNSYLISTLGLLSVFISIESRAYTGEYKTVRTGIRISSMITELQLEFINTHYDYVLTSFLSNEVRGKIKGPKLLLYRSIQDGWEGFNHFDWAHIDSNENMFAHHNGKRIWTIYKSWLMEPGDMVSPDSPDALNHWINYYAVTASEQVYRFDYDGLFMDSAGHKLWRRAVYGKMPDGYSDEYWRDARRASLRFIKSYLPDKIVIFNGLHSRNGAEYSLQFTDGGMWETFGFRPEDSRYYGEKRWREAIETFERYREDKLLSFVSKRKDLTRDIKTRIFILASYLLTSSENTALTMIDLNYGPGGELLYYPEYEIDLGRPMGSYKTTEEGIYARKFEKGLVLVNPSGDKYRTVKLDGEYDKLIPVGGGPIPEDGKPEGSIIYKSVGDEITLPPLSGAVLIKR